MRLRDSRPWQGEGRPGEPAENHAENFTPAKELYS